MKQKIGIGAHCRRRNAERSWMMLLTAMMVMVAMSLSGCMPMGEEKVNAELFKDKQDMQKKASEIHVGMTKKQVFKRLGISPAQFTRMNMAEVQTSIYGNSVVQGTPEELDRFREKMMAFEGYSLPYVNIASDGSLGFAKMKVKETGHDLRMVLIFHNGRLFKTAVEGTHQVNRNENRYLWNTILRTGVGKAF